MIDLLEEVRALEMHQRLTTGKRGRFTPAELLAAATATVTPPWAGTAAAGRRRRRRRPGDHRPVPVRTAGSEPDQIHYSATAADVRDVIINGRRVVRDRRHALGDVGALLAETLTDLSPDRSALEDR